MSKTIIKFIAQISPTLDPVVDNRCLSDHNIRLNVTIIGPVISTPNDSPFDSDYNFPDYSISWLLSDCLSRSGLPLASLLLPFLFICCESIASFISLKPIDHIWPTTVFPQKSQCWEQCSIRVRLPLRASVAAVTTSWLTTRRLRVRSLRRSLRRAPPSPVICADSCRWTATTTTTAVLSAHRPTQSVWATPRWSTPATTRVCTRAPSTRASSTRTTAMWPNCWCIRAVPTATMVCTWPTLRPTTITALPQAPNDGSTDQFADQFADQTHRNESQTRNQSQTICTELLIVIITDNIFS